MKRNPHIAQLAPHYLFPLVQMRVKEFKMKQNHADLISLGIGNTTEPIPPSIAEAMSTAALNLSTREGYSGYGPEAGIAELRNKIADTIYGGSCRADDIFVSDGSKCDLGRLQTLFGGSISIAVQNPAYPVYLDGSMIHGVAKIVDMPCIPENGFFPDLAALERTDVIYFCSPNNPTGAVATREQLSSLVEFAAKNRSLIVFDAAYSGFIRNEALPKSIFEIDGAKNVAIETNSFSKLAGFTGVRLGWTVVPKELSYDDGSSLHADWMRLHCTLFNGASNIAQQGGIQALETASFHDIMAITAFYLENSAILKQAFESAGYETFGGENAPYLWVRCPHKTSWDAFQYFLEELHLITTPGSGFGAAGEGFIRCSAFGSRTKIETAAERIASARP